MALIATLVALGLVLLFLETIMPGLIVGTVGLLCLVAAVVVGYRNFDIATGNTVLLVVVGCLVVGAILWVNLFPKSPLARMFVSRGVVGDIGTDRPSLLHQTGVALTPLRPSGMAEIGGQRVDVVTEGGFIDRGQPVRVVAIEGLRVVVRQT